MCILSSSFLKNVSTFPVFIEFLTTYLLCFLQFTPSYSSICASWKPSIKKSNLNFGRNLNQPSCFLRQQIPFSYLRLSISHNILGSFCLFEFYDVEPGCLFTLVAAGAVMACLCLCIGKSNNEKKLMVRLQVRSNQVFTIIPLRTDDKSWWGDGSQYTFPERPRDRREQWEPPTETELICSLIDIYEDLSQSSAVSLSSGERQGWLTAAARVLWDRRHSHVACKSYSNQFLVKTARTVPGSRTPARLCSPAVACTSLTGFQNVFGSSSPQPRRWKRAPANNV